MHTLGSRSVDVSPSSARGDWPQLASLLLAIPGCVWLVSLARFYRRFMYDDASGRAWGIADDMYISACFGRSLFSGVVWNQGAPKVEGTSNPLWAAALGALHELPGFTEQRLGMVVVSLNALFLLAVVLLFGHTAQLALGLRASGPLERRFHHAPAAPGAEWIVSITAALLLPWCWSLSYWSAEGFEVALLALLTYAGMYLALLPRTAASCLALGVVLVMGFATRVDFAVLASAIIAIALGHGRGSRLLLLWTLLLGVALLYVLLVLRREYYGAWLPPAYYIETKDLRRGLQQHQALLLTAWLAFLPLLLPRVRRNLGARLPFVLAGLWAFGLAVLYSCFVGGDAWLFAGHDRHTAVAVVLLCWSLCLLSALAARTWYMRTLCSVWCLLLVAAPLLAQHGVKQLERALIAASSSVRD